MELKVCYKHYNSTLCNLQCLLLILRMFSVIEVSLPHLNTFQSENIFHLFCIFCMSYHTCVAVVICNACWVCSHSINKGGHHLQNKGNVKVRYVVECRAIIADPVGIRLSFKQKKMLIILPFVPTEYAASNQ